MSDYGFSGITIINSPPSEGDPHSLFLDPTIAQFSKRFLYSIAKALEVIGGGKILLGTSLEVTAVKKPLKENDVEPNA